MVSLNEKRSKIRYVVQNKTDWVDDGNKFGKRMLEKMGWQSGVGLGKNEDGMTEHIDLKYKANLKGVGFVNGKYDDTWIAHSQSFDSVLQQLQQSHPSPSQSSLHDFNQTVKQTKTRFTYKKQSSGKDLSSRTNDELDCIFGWNKANQKANNETKQQSDEEQEKESETISDNFYITSKKSIHDYFKEKSLKKAQRRTESTNCEQTDSVDEPSSSPQITSDDPIINEDDEPTVKKTKKKKRNDNNTDEDEKSKKKKNEIEDPYPSSNLSELIGYKGWNVDLSFEDIIKKKR